MSRRLAPRFRVRVQALLLGCAAAFAVSACQVTINQQSTTDPCDPNPCLAVGVCTGWTATCTSPDGTAVCGAWTPSGPSVGTTLTKPAGYEVIETLCDGQDNDCNGLTDEGVSAPKGACSALGVCAGQPASHAICNAGSWLCDWTGVAGYEATEVSCDGKDNDCNGKTDDNVAPSAMTCKRAGVCASLPAPACTNGGWDCQYGGADYEAVESACDGKDNDCDGIVDANLTVTGLSCLGAGVCANGVKQVCAGGVAVCDYSGVAGFEAFEQSCDGQDNDCDGQTDNLAGSNLALQAKNIDDCPGIDKGVCLLHKDAIYKRCETGKFVCHYDAVAKYESPESSCDGKDNDCDGNTDDNLLGPSPSPCPSFGVCINAKAKCSAGLWMCDWSSLPPSANYEAFETLCDGKDNDCDGLTDETVTAKSAKCNSKGVCAFGALATCPKANGPLCDFSHIAGFQTVETLCDGLDNDCDGQTDEPDALDASSSGCTKGVCALANPACVPAGWDCSGAKQLADYEAVESKCDGLDNDCDGFTDEGAVDSSVCKSKGVCAAGVPAACVDKQAICIYQSVKGYENTEVSCDGLDNNCDGTTDLNVCGPSAPCQGDVDCTTGTCAKVLGGSSSAKACTIKPNQCAAIGDFGVMVFADDAATRCLTSKSVAACTAGTWGTPTVCGASLPVCVNGACLLCTPNALRCDPADATKIQQCAVDGKSVASKGACGVGDHCSGDGVCVPDGSFAVSDTTAGYGGVVAVLSSGTIATAWLSDASAVASVNIRLFGADGVAAGAKAPVQGSTPAVKGSQLAITAVGDGFALAWVSKAAGDSDIYVRLFGADGVAKGPAFIANSNDQQGEQTEPALAGNATALIATWTTENDGTGTPGISAQRFDSTGQLAGDLFTANEDLNGNFLDDPKLGTQNQSAVALRADGSFAVVWVHVDGPSKQRIRGHLFNAASAPLASVVLFSGSNGTASRPGVAPFAKGFAVVWAGTATDGTGSGIGMRQADGNLGPLAQPSAVNTIVAGDQVEPTIAQLASGGAIIGWTSPQAISVADGLEISSRALSPDGTFADPENVLTTGESSGDQSLPRVAVFADGRIAWVWRFLATSTDPSQVRMLLQ